MLGRIFIFGAIFLVFAVAIGAILAILDVVAFSALGESLGRLAAIIGVATIAAALIFLLTKQAMKK
jgi:hypothetical protein